MADSAEGSDGEIRPVAAAAAAAVKDRLVFINHVDTYIGGNLARVCIQ